ncbi:CrcB-like protein-domain-containing protein [Lipomyces orientalis]|uniref:CrcB-like protein-domain-containing protein n=1 Tax=Lipomyces orientalis TaxID=1233043 RepID=A0ACC3TWY1_9ASCO
MAHPRRSYSSTRGITDTLASDIITDDLASDEIHNDRSASNRRFLEGEYAEELRLGRTRSSTSAYGVNEVEASLPLAGDDRAVASLEHQITQESESEVLERQHPQEPESIASLSATQTNSRYRCHIGDITEVLFWLVFFTILGVLARLGLTALESYPGQSVDPLVWVQFVGCVVMGFLSQSKDFFSVNDGRNLQIFVGLTTGFCGSMTTFSSWMREIFLALANANPYHERSRGYSVLGLLDGVIVTLCLSLAGIKFGAHVGLYTRSLWNGLMRRSSSEKINGDGADESSSDKQKYGFGMVTGRRTIPFLKLLAMILGPGCWIGSVLMAIFISKWRGIVLFALVFGPPGTLSRWLLARYMNPLRPSFPLGTFIANIVGTVLISILTIIQQRVDNTTGCQVLQGMMDGYCGCLTTVSTFALELLTLQRNHAWRYGSASVVCGVLITCLTMGVDHWRYQAFVERTC